jgi:hypothetical protein
MRTLPLPLPLPLLAAVALLAVVSRSVPAQTPLYASVGDADGDEYGATLADVGDVDGDGLSDMAVGAPSASVGALRVLSGADGSLIQQLDGFFAGDRFGQAVTGIGDADGDGYADYAVGAPGSPFPETSHVYLVSGQTGHVMLSFAIVGDPLAAGGSSLATLGDLDADGQVEFAAGVPQLGNVGPGAVLVLRFTLFDRVYGELSGLSPGDQFGIDVANAGDVDLDGIDDLVVGTGAGGYARVYSGATLGLLHHFTGPGAGYGRVVAGVGDLNADGHGDVAVASPGLNFVDIFSGATGALLRRFDALSGDFGSAIAALGDLDGDGVPDLAVGAPNDNALGLAGSGSTVILSGATGGQLFKFVGNVAQAQAGGALAALADVSGDGKAELAVGAVGEGSVALPDAGRAAVYSGALAGLILPYGFGCPDSFLITPAIEMIGEPSAGGLVTLSITRGFPGSTAFVFVGTGQGLAALSNGCILWVDPLLPPIIQLPLGGVFPGSGSALVFGRLPATLPPGSVLTFQAFEPVLDTPGEIATTGAVQLTTY